MALHKGIPLHAASHGSQRPRNSPLGKILFYGENFNDAAQHFQFSVLSGDQPPTIIGGYAKWQVIDRPRRRGLTVFQGYDPIIMQLSLRFINPRGNWTDEAAALGIEEDISKLEWMAGTGYEKGPPPKVWLSTFDGNGNTVPLIPFTYQAATPNEPKFFGGGDANPWIITGLTWDTAPLRLGSGVRAGYRVRQDATVTVQAYSPASEDVSTGKARTKATTFVSRAGADTALKIARREPTVDAAILAQAIRTAPQNKHLQLRSVNQAIKHGKRVYIPSGI